MFTNVDKIQAIEEAIANAANVDLEDVHSSDRKGRAISDVRAGVWYVAYRIFGIPYHEIAKYYEKHHTSIMEGVRRADGGVIAEKAEAIARKKCPALFTPEGLRKPETADNWKV